MGAKRVSGGVRRVGKKSAAKVEVPKRKLELKYVPIEKLKKWKKNPRRNDQAAVKLLGLLKEHGFIDPIIATPDKVIRAGHTRLKAAQKTDLDELPVIFVDFDSEEQAEMYAVADNRANEWAEWDEDDLSVLLAKRRKLPDQKLAAMSGFERTEIDGLRAGGDLGAEAPGEFPAVDEDIETEHRCPKCGYEWSGKVK